MTPAITLDELLEWNDEASRFWKAHLEANPALLELPCDIGGVSSVRDFARHIWGVELRWAQRAAGLPLTPREELASLPDDKLYTMHEQAMEAIRAMLANPAHDWNARLTLEAAPWLPAQFSNPSLRKVVAHGLLHSQRHYAQLATLVRAAGHPSGFRGDLLMSAALE